MVFSIILIVFTSTFCFGIKQTLIIDSDPGLGAPWTLDIDDDFALLYAMQHHDVRLISTVKGCSSATNTYENAKRLMKLFEEKIPVAFNENAVPSIVQATKKSKNAVTWLGIGPTTHFAESLQKNPELKDNIDKIVILGGDTRGIKEFNFWHDINSTNYLLNIDVPLYVFPVDRTLPLFLTNDNVDYLLSNECSNFYNLHKWRIFFFTHFFTFQHRRVYQIPRFDFGTQLWDVTPVLWITWPEGFEEFECFRFNNFEFTPSDCSENSVRIGKIKNETLLMQKFLDTMCHLPHIQNDGRIDGSEMLILLLLSLMMLSCCGCVCKSLNRKLKSD